jgi:hypothetical protein
MWAGPTLFGSDVGPEWASRFLVFGPWSTKTLGNPCTYASGRCWARTSDLRLVEAEQP